MPNGTVLAFGRLRAALSVPACRFPARPPARGSFDERKEKAGRWADLRAGVDAAIEIVVEIAEDDEAAYPGTREEADSAATSTRPKP
ncbi:hypothetical protein ACIP79_38750 [Streptomyces sp. NPDC088747]|uniref:hypothetical protein n=1 Tax=Streptomyces sp. NPDC088747 TaxID=3365886 RepID=UPI00380FCF24